MDFVLDLLKENIGWLLTFVIATFGVLSTALKQATVAIKESADVGVAVEEAMADDKITNAEITKIVKEAKEAAIAWGGFWKSLISIFKRKVK